uniref:Calcium-activated chloride channel N-terminal domain-containing protein n=1 Tax=Strigamia maritima TaxID=126957 RepID=T1IPK9_STRMM
MLYTPIVVRLLVAYIFNFNLLTDLMFIRASEFLHVATNQLTSFEEIIIILPFNSGNTSAQQLWNSVEKSDILIVQKPTIYPYTQQSQGCRHPASSLLDNWIRLRYGVFEEHGWEKDDLYPDIYWESGQMKLTQCINKYMTNETPFPAYSTDEIHLCNNESHNYNAPTRQNVLCSYRSIWDVMMEHDDFQNNLKPHQYLQPKFKIMKQAQLHVVFIIDASHHYHSMLLQFQQAMAFLILNELPKHTLVTLIEHKEGNAELLLKLTEITDMQSREDFLYTLPNEPNGQPNLEAALIIADKVYKNHSKYQTVFYIPIFGKFEGASQIDKISTYPKYDSANINNINNIVLPEAKNIGKSLNHALNKILHQYYPNTQHTITIINELYTKGKTYNFYTETDTDELIVTIVSTVLDSIQEVVLIPPINSPILLTHSEMCTQDLSRRIATCRVLQPESGLWRLAIISDDSLQDIIVDITVKCTSCVSVQSWLSMSHIIKTSTRDLPFIYAQLSSPTKFLNATVIAHVKHAPTRKQKSIELIDNGKDPDIIKADNIYTAILSPLKEAGWYYITISINVTKEASVSKYLHLQRQVLTGSIYLDERIPDDSSMRYPTRVLDLHIDVSTTEQDNQLNMTFVGVKT